MNGREPAGTRRLGGALIVFAGLLGAAGVALAAAAAHGGEGRLLAGASAIALAHAPALLALAALAPRAPRGLLVAGSLMALGATLFCGDLAARQFLGDRLFASAAPFGGMLMIAGWLATAFSGIFSLLRRG